MTKRIAMLSVVILLLGAALGVLSSKPSGANQRVERRQEPSETSATEAAPTRTKQAQGSVGALHRSVPQPMVMAHSVPRSVSSAASKSAEWERQVGIERTIGPDGRPIPLTDEEEREAQLIIDNNSMQREWRADFVKQRRDDEWTKQMERDLRSQQKELLSGNKLSIENLSCRETICRMYLQFEDQLDAEAFKAAQRDPNLKFEFQSLDPTFKGEGFDRSNFMYEVIVRRPPPETPRGHTSQPGDVADSDSNEGSASAMSAESSG